MMTARIDQSPGCVDLLVDRHVRSGHGEHIALVEQGSLGRRTLTYKQLQALTIELSHDLAISLAGSLTQRRIALVGGGTLEIICYWLAAMRSGHLPLLVHPDLPSDQYPALWECFDPALILQDRTARHPAGLQCQRVDEILASLPDRRVKIAEVGAFAGSFDLRPALVLATSGSTGRAKLCMHPHRSFWEFERTVTRKMWGITRDDKVLGSSGPYFSFGLQGVHVPLSVGATAVLLPEWKNHTDFLDTIESEVITAFMAVPTLYHLLMSRAQRPYDLSSLALSLSAGESLPDIIRSRWEHYSGSQMLDSIGTTETFAPYLSEMRNTDNCLERVEGFEYAEIAVNADLDDIPASERALTFALSKGCMMLDYLVSGSSAVHARLDAPFLTKDVFVRAGGGFRFLSRDSERVKVAGQWVCPQQLEEHLLADRRVERAAAVPITTPEGLVRLRAYIVLGACGVSGEDVVTALMRRIHRELKPKALRPDRIDVVQHIASTPSGKLKRQDLHAHIPTLESPIVRVGVMLFNVE
jgi:acyl-coenzyme A synthetase/AMP-(fatty) acid ligase